jgi:hypothetical protein
MSGDHIYWLYSAAAQSIAAFVALMLAGYALVHTFMEAAREKDDTLDEIHAVLRRKYHSRLALLAWTTGIAIILSLVTVFVNRWEFHHKIWLLGVSAAIDTAAIVGGLAFVVAIVNPRKYEIIAARELRDRLVRAGRASEIAPVATFLEEYRRLELLIRQALQSRASSISTDGPPRMSLSFRQMIEVLVQNEVIDSALCKELEEIYKYRNLVIHGRVESADIAMIERTQAAVERMSAVYRM